MTSAVGPALDRAVDAHRARWGEPHRVARAPGRVNLIGEHTDYNDGFCLPMALPFDTVVAMSDEGDAERGRVHVVSEGFGEVVVTPGDDPAATVPWARHLAGVVHLLGSAGVPSGGWRATVATDIPTGASLSSSAAIEVATTVALVDRAGRAWSPIDIARLGQRVEHEVVGLASGIMDQLISAGAVEGAAGLIDCRSLILTPVPLPPGTVVAVLDTGTRRVLAEAAYGDRRAACERAARAIGVPALRDATLDQVESLTDPELRARARHVVTENRRTLDAVAAMQRGDAVALGRLMSASHASLRDDFEVSSPALDHMVGVAHHAPGCLGARMTGGGFAGCAVALVDGDRIEAFTRAVLDADRHDGHRVAVWPCAASAGASTVASC